MTPTPSTAMRSSDMAFGLLELYGGNAARAQVLTGALRDGQWCVDIARIHVLLDDREHVDAEPLDRGEQRWHVRDSAGWLGHGAELHGLTEREVLRLDLGAHLRIDLFEVEVADTLGRPLDDRDVVATAVADVTGVQAQVDELAVGAVEEAIDVLLGVHMTVRMRMVLRTHTVLFEHRLAELIHALGLLAPLRGVQAAIFEHSSRCGIAPHLGDDDDVLAADRGC